VSLDRGVGWARLGYDDRIAGWAEAARDAARRVLAGAEQPWRCGGTWFVGVDALPNGTDGALSGVAFPWRALPLEPEPLHPGQLSVIRPGYPKPSPDETPAAFAFRRDRDAAHLDGLLAIGSSRARMVKEPHGWILGLPLNECGATASPLVVWEGSHKVMRTELRAALQGYSATEWSEVDLTAVYLAARRKVFETCKRVELPARPGQATLIHRLTLHGVAPWREGAAAPPEGRMIAYFRPVLTSVAEWLEMP
jgi:hypothetical protein